jgi:predicted amidophosphoribosyltransferase
LRSLIDDIEELLALGKGDKYRLMDMRARLETNKRLYISDREFLRNLVKTYLGRAMLSPIPNLQLTKTLASADIESYICKSCGAKVSSDNRFCTSCGTKHVETTSDSSTPKLAQKSEDYEEEEGFSINLDGEVGEKTNRETARTRSNAKSETKPDICTNCGFKMNADEIFCISCGAKHQVDSILDAPKPIPQPIPQSQSQSQSQSQPKSKSKPKPKSKSKPTKKKITPVSKSRKEELEEYEKKYLKKLGTTLQKTKLTTTSKETTDNVKHDKPKLSLCVRCGSVMNQEEKFCTNCGAKR